jgi:hypothetical protein
MIPDPHVLAAHLGADTLVLIVGGEQTFLVAITGSPETKGKMVTAYRQAGLPVQIATDAGLADSADHEHAPQTDGHLDIVCPAQLKRPLTGQGLQDHAMAGPKGEPANPTRPS